jgi:putative endonuclease
VTRGTPCTGHCEGQRPEAIPSLHTRSSPQPCHIRRTTSAAYSDALVLLRRKARFCAQQPEASVVTLPMARQYFVYIIANRRKTVLYTGVTNDLIKRVSQHRNRQGSRFTAKYNCRELVLYEILKDPYSAIRREKQIKAGSRRRKIELIERLNPGWRDLYEDLVNSTAGSKP